MTSSRRAAGLAASALVLGLPLQAQVTFRASVSGSGVQGNGGSPYSRVSGDGQHVAFYSGSDNLVAGDSNQTTDVFVRDLLTQTTQRVSVSTTGLQAAGSSGLTDGLALSADGRFVAFVSSAPNLVPGDTNGFPDVFVRDRLGSTTERVSVATSGAQANGFSGAWGVAISGDGRFVVFSSDATNLVTPDTNFAVDVFVRDRLLGTTERVSVDSQGMQGNNSSYDRLCISDEGRYVCFGSLASNLVGGDTNEGADVFVRDRLLGTTERVSLGAGGVEGDGWSQSPSMTSDGRFVAFSSTASNLVSGDTGFVDDIFVRDRLLGTTERASLSTGGAAANNACELPCLSADGRFVTFSSLATNLVPGDSNGVRDTFVRDRQAGTTARASVSSAGAQGNGSFGSGWPSISADGRIVDFVSDATNLVGGDSNEVADIFVRDLAASGFSSLCDAAAAGLPACPCANPPSGAGRGCDNSSASGGAQLSASGAAYLATDSLRFSAIGVTPSALCILMQGNAAIPEGAVFGQGLRCLGGTIIRRLFHGAASLGAITLPPAGDAAVSARSGALGDPILPGESRWYLVYYRDPVVLGGCPGSFTFNATQTGRVSWSP